MSEAYEVIAAFADGERVDVERFDRALADPAGRAYLIDLLVLRGLVGEQTSQDIQVLPLPAPVDPPRPVARLFAIAASVLLLVASGLGGFVAGHRFAAAVAPPVTPVVIDQIVLPDTQISAPAPTRVIHIEPGVDWKQSAGGD